MWLSTLSHTEGLWHFFYELCKSFAHFSLGFDLFLVGSLLKLLLFYALQIFFLLSQLCHADVLHIYEIIYFKTFKQNFDFEFQLERPLLSQDQKNFIQVFFQYFFVSFLHLTLNIYQDLDPGIRYGCRLYSRWLPVVPKPCTDNLDQSLTHTFMMPPLSYTKFPNISEQLHSWNFCPVSLAYYSK